MRNFFIRRRDGDEGGFLNLPSSRLKMYAFFSPHPYPLSRWERGQGKDAQHPLLEMGNQPLCIVD